jgi:hypothetical protein
MSGASSASEQKNSRVTMMVIREVNRAVTGTNANLHRVVTIVDGLWIVVQHQDLPLGRGEPPSSNVDIERLWLWLLRSWSAVENGVLPAIEGRDCVLLKGIPIQDAFSMGRIRSQDRDSGLGKHRTLS